MSSKYNLVQKPKKEDEEIEEEIETELESENEKTPSSSAAAKSRMIKFMGIIIIVAVVLILLLFVITIFSKPKYTYSQIESVLRDAAISYCKDYPESLPKDEGSIVEIDSSNLIRDVQSYPLITADYRVEQVTPLSADARMTITTKCGDIVLQMRPQLDLTLQGKKLFDSDYIEFSKAMKNGQSCSFCLEDGQYLYIYSTNLPSYKDLTIEPVKGLFMD